MFFSQRLKALGLTKRDLADKINVRHETVIRWREAPPTYVTLLLKCWEQNRESMREAVANEAPANLP